MNDPSRPATRAVGIVLVCLAVGLGVGIERIPFSLVLLIVLLLTSFYSFDLFMCASVFLFPWHPLIDIGLPFRDIFLLDPLTMFVGSAIILFREKRSISRWLFHGKINWAVLFFTAVATVSIFVSVPGANVNSLRALTRLYSYVAVFYSLTTWLKTREDVKRILRLLMIATIVLDLFGFLQLVLDGYTDIYFWIYPFQRETLPPWDGRIISLLFQPNALAGYLNLIIPFAVAIALFDKDRRMRRLGYTCAILSAIAVLCTQSRGGELGLAAIIVIFGSFCTSGWAGRIKLFASGALIGAVLIALILTKVGPFQRVSEGENDSRLALWGAAILLFDAHPVLGVGYGNYRTVFSEFVPGATAESVDAHNIYLEALAETGVVGFIAFLAMPGVVFYSFGRTLRNLDTMLRIVSLGVCGAFAGVLVHGFVDYLFNVNPQFGILFFAIIAVGVAVKQLPPEASGQKTIEALNGSSS